MSRILPVLMIIGCIMTGILASAQDNITMQLSPTRHSAEWRALNDGSWEVTTTGGDPYILMEEITEAYDPAKLTVFAFEYKLEKPLDVFEIYLIAPLSGWSARSKGPIEVADDWQTFAMDVSTIVPDEWDGRVKQFRIDFGSDNEQTLQLRNITLRPRTAEEIQADEIRLAQERKEREELLQKIEASLIAPKNITDISNRITATQLFTDGVNNTAIAVLGKDLDLPTLVREQMTQVPPSVTLPPSIVVGEGASPQNHTVVRILNQYGICETQFLAYPPSVQGGVQVTAGMFFDTQPGFVAVPLSDDTIQELRIFNAHGNQISAFSVSDTIAPPFAVTVGNFNSTAPGDEIAIASLIPATASIQLLIYSPSGELLQTVKLDTGASSTSQLNLATQRLTTGDAILAYRTGQTEYLRVVPQSNEITRLQTNLEPDCTGIFPSAFGNGATVATVNEDLLSHVLRLSEDGNTTQQNVGERENLFWFTNYGTNENVPQGEYTRHSIFDHIRTDFASPVAQDPDFSRTDMDYWAGPKYEAQVASRLARYDSEPPVCWEPCFTHRWFYGQAKKWANAIDEETGLPAYTLCSRENKTGTYGEFGQTDAFVTGTYAPEVSPIDCLYTYPQRTFLHGLVQKFRNNPENFVAVEPNHEMEINAESQTTHGDYNPNMIRGFYRYLISLYGNIENINMVFGTQFTPDKFDAPRNLLRGEWDSYSISNQYYLVWMRYMNYVVYRVIAGTYREALLAGFPPEAIKCHQIPDHYAISSLTAFSKPAQRVTPIDWNLNAGVGFGFTRYGVWYNQEFNCVQGPYSSGFDAMVVGEYQSLTPDAEAAYQQLVYMRDHGIQFIHCMNWPPDFDDGYNASLAQALERLVANEAPRPGQTGGTGQVRPVITPENSYDIVSLGTGENNTGLLKSINAEGDWEGSVYVTPFHAHIAIESLMQKDTHELAVKPLIFSPFTGISAGNLLEVSFLARTSGTGSVSLKVYHHDIELPDLRLVTPVNDQWQHVRFLVRIQIDTDDVNIELGSGDANSNTYNHEFIELKDLLAVRHTEQTTRLKKGIFAGERHQGGVTFDVLPAN